MIPMGTKSLEAAVAVSLALDDRVEKTETEALETLEKAGKEREATAVELEKRYGYDAGTLSVTPKAPPRPGSAGEYLSKLITLACACGKPMRLERPGKPSWYGQHCITCHEYQHSACRGCGVCLPKSRSWVDGRTRGARYDRVFCSNACRQKAYRAKRRAASVNESSAPE